MPFAPFHELCPTVAKAETRTVTLLESRQGIPAGDYGFVEMFCDEENCDCRRVFFMVMSSVRKDVEAVIAWGWEDEAFYKRWLGMNDPAMAAEMRRPCLNLGSPQSKIAPALLDLAQAVLLSDPAYVDRIKRHYALFRAKVDEGAGIKAPRKKKSRKGGRWRSSRAERSTDPGLDRRRHAGTAGVSAVGGAVDELAGPGSAGVWRGDGGRELAIDGWHLDVARSPDRATRLATGVPAIQQ